MERQLKAKAFSCYFAMANAVDFDNFWNGLNVEQKVTDCKLLVSSAHSEVLTLLEAYREQCRTYLVKINDRQESFEKDLCALQEVYVRAQADTFEEMESLARKLNQTNDVIEAQKYSDQIRTLAHGFDNRAIAAKLETEMDSVSIAHERRLRSIESDLLDCTERANQMKSQAHLKTETESSVLRCTLSELREAFWAMLSDALGDQRHTLRQLENEYSERKFEIERQHLDIMQVTLRQHDAKMQEIQSDGQSRLNSVRSYLSSLPNRKEIEILQLNAQIGRLELDEHENKVKADDTKSQISKTKKEAEMARHEWDKREAQTISQRVRLEAKEINLHKKIGQLQNQLKVLTAAEKSKFDRLKKNFKIEAADNQRQIDRAIRILERDIYGAKIPSNCDKIELLQETKALVANLVKSLETATR